MQSRKGSTRSKERPQDGVAASASGYSRDQTPQPHHAPPSCRRHPPAGRHDAGAASAQSLNCGGRFFGVGDAKLSVIQQCGEPLLKESICVPRQELVWLPSMYPGAPAQQVLTQQCVAMEEWTYHRGQGNFMSIARFYNGTIESARDGIRAP